MKLVEATRLLAAWDARGVPLFSTRDLAKVFDETNEALRSTIRRLLAAQVLDRVARGLYWYALSARDCDQLLAYSALMLRRGQYVFESLESAASKWGIISQVPVDRITVMTTGREGLFRTPFGNVEFVHTDAAWDQIARDTVDAGNGLLPVASRERCVRDLVRCRRSTYLVDWEELNRDQD